MNHSVVAFADVVHQLISFSPDVPQEALLLKLIDTKWLQRLRDVSQTANTRLVYMFSEHSRFGHSLGTAYLACQVLTKLERQYPDEVKPWSMAVAAAALLHDIGHLAPGSHLAQRVWFPGEPDSHEELAVRLLTEDSDLVDILETARSGLAAQVISIMIAAGDAPSWTSEIISGGGWNVDRGNWCIVDSILSGVSYGRYNIPALTESLLLVEGGHLALRENRLDAMLHFAVSRHAMYQQMYLHRVILALDTLTTAIVQRARDLGSAVPFADDTMLAVLSAVASAELSLKDIAEMRESWWRYHLYRWTAASDTILADLSQRLLERKLFKTVRLPNAPEQAQELTKAATAAVKACGYDARYYLHRVSTENVNSADRHQSLKVLRTNGEIEPLSAADPLLRTLLSDAGTSVRSWLAMPSDAKDLLQS